MRQPRAVTRSGASSFKRSDAAAKLEVATCNEVIMWTSDAELFLPFSYILKAEGFIPLWLAPPTMFWLHARSACRAQSFSIAPTKSKMPFPYVAKSGEPPHLTTRSA